MNQLKLWRLIGIYKWQSHDPIFVTKEGKPSSHKYIGKTGSFAFTKAVALMMRRTKQNYSNHFIRLNWLYQMSVEEATREKES